MLNNSKVKVEESIEREQDVEPVEVSTTFPEFTFQF